MSHRGSPTASGADDFVEMTEWAEIHLDFLQRFYPYERGIPSHNTLNDVMNAFDNQVFESLFVDWVNALSEVDADLVSIDGQTINDFEANLKNNLYKLWNRLSSGSYYPPLVKSVAIPKKSGGKRLLGIPTVADRVAQTVVRNRFEPLVEPHFLSDSYSYRPRKSALDAVAVTRQRCWKQGWVLEFDIKGVFDHIRHDLLMKAVRKHTDNP